MKRYIRSAIKSFSEEDQDTQRAIVRRSTRPEELATYADSDDYFIQLELAHNPNTPVEVLEKFSTFGNDDNVRGAVVENPNTPVEWFPNLYSTGGWSTRFALAHCPRTPAEILDKLTKDKNFIGAVAQNPNTSVETLVALTKNSNSDARYWAALNPHTPVSAVRKMEGDSNLDVRRAIRMRLNAEV